MADNQRKNNEQTNSKLVKFGVIGGLIVLLILIFGTVLTGRLARRDTDTAVKTVSLFYLGELAGRREEVVSASLQNSINTIRVAVRLMEDGDLQDMEHLQAYQLRMKQLYNLDKFAFVDTDGLIYTSVGTQTNISEYPFDHETLSEPEVSVMNPESSEKKAIIAVPIDPVSFEKKTLNICFMEISMEHLLEGVSLQTNNAGTTFCNIYTRDGIPLTDLVLGGLAEEGSLLEAMDRVSFDKGYSRKKFADDFEKGTEGSVSFSYNGIEETLYYMPVRETDWMLTYLIRASVINDQIGVITGRIITRSLFQSILTAAVLLCMFGIMIRQIRRSSQLRLEIETAAAENRIGQEALESRLALQEQLLEQEKRRAEQDSMITALASDYRSVYYVNLDTDEAICYRADLTVEDAVHEWEHFAYYRAFADYAEKYVTEAYRQSFLEFIEPDNIRKGLEKEAIISCRYLIRRDGAESYEMLRAAGVRHAEDRTDHIVHAVGMGFTNVDSETRETLAMNERLRDALSAAETANKAKTAFLSNMSHEIRTPMNAIIGLDNIALNDPDISDRTHSHLVKIGDAANHLLQIVNDILDMSRIESGRMVLKNEEFSFSRMLEQINTMISGQCQDKGLEYDCRIIGPVDDYYIGDDVKIRQVLINILGNAVKFTPEGGKISFTVERTARFDGRSTLCMTVSDTGIGMDKEFVPKIFDSFSQEDSSTTSKYGSTGLGMAITKSMVDIMNGTIDVQSEKGKGTVVTVTLTLLDAEPQSGTDADDFSPQDLSVLVVDDDPIACEHAALVLSGLGIVSESCMSGREALEKVQLRQARNEPYNLILLDWKMPDLDGVETARRIRSIAGQESAIIILTAYKWDDVYQEALDAGVDSFLAKPLFASNALEEFRTSWKKKYSARMKKHRADLTGRRILVAEDIQINADIIIMLLSMREIRVDHALNGKIAVDMFASHPENYYDAILMDMRMPEMDGLAATSAIREMDRKDAKQIPIIALTANAFDEDVRRSLQTGLNAHLSKPVDPENLFETLESLIPDDQNS